MEAILNPDNLKSAVCQIRSAKRGAKFVKHAYIAEAVAKVLGGSGTFHHGDDNLLRYFSNDTRDIQLLGSRNFEVYLSRLTGLNGTEEAYKYVYRHLENLAHLQPLVPIHTLTWYDATTSELRRFMGRGKVLRRSLHGSWESIDNGADGIIFHDDPVEPCEPEFEANGTGLAWYLEQLRFSSQGVLTRDDRCDAYLLWLVHQHFPSLRRMRLVLAAIGEPESGKSSLIRATGRVLVGPSFMETYTSKEDAFTTAVSCAPVIMLDNWDNYEAWFKTKLNLYVTGATQTTRELYTTAGQRVLIPRSILGLSSNSPKFRATDVSQRLLITEMEKPAPLKDREIEVRAEHKIRAEFEVHWPAIIGDLLILAGRVADSYAEVVAPPQVFRAADYEEMAFHYYRVTKPEAPNASRALIKKLMRAQSDFATQDDPLIDVLRALLAATYRLNPIGLPAAQDERNEELKEEVGLELMFLKKLSSAEGVIGPITSATLAHTCGTVGEHLHIRMPWKGVRGFGQYLTKHIREIETQLNVRVSEEISHARERNITITANVG